MRPIFGSGPCAIFPRRAGRIASTWNESRRARRSGSLDIAPFAKCAWSAARAWREAIPRPCQPKMASKLGKGGAVPCRSGRARRKSLALIVAQQARLSSHQLGDRDAQLLRSRSDRRQPEPSFCWAPGCPANLIRLSTQRFAGEHAIVPAWHELCGILDRYVS